MRLKIRCDGESEKICKIFRELNKALVPEKFCKIFQILRHIESLDVCMEY